MPHVKPKHVVIAGEEAAELREEPAGGLAAKQLVDAVDEAKLGGAEGGLVEDAAQQLAMADDHRAVVLRRLPPYVPVHRRGVLVPART